MELAERHAAARQLLAAIEAEMRTQGLWAADLPSAQALQSVMPFMYDTLKLQEWLQFIFLPRTRALIEQGQGLPANCHIHPLAEHEFTRVEADTCRLLDLIRQMDNLLNAP